MLRDLLVPVAVSVALIAFCVWFVLSGARRRRESLERLPEGYRVSVRPTRREAVAGGVLLLVQLTLLVTGTAAGFVACWVLMVPVWVLALRKRDRLVAAYEGIAADARARAPSMEHGELRQLVTDLERLYGGHPFKPLRELLA